VRGGIKRRPIGRSFSKGRSDLENTKERARGKKHWVYRGKNCEFSGIQPEQDEINVAGQPASRSWKGSSGKGEKCIGKG